MNLLHEYKNGNYVVKLYDDGTKERIFDTYPEPVYPESIDIKVTNYCDAACSYCHEQSTTKGKHSNEDNVVSVLKQLPAGVEIAVGGGNPLAWDGVHYSLNDLNTHGLVFNITVNAVHVRKFYYSIINNNIFKGIGISYNKAFSKECFELAESNPNVIFHLIMGVHSIDDLNKIISNVKSPKVLLLGYKQFGRGANYYNSKVQDNINSWYTMIHTFFKVKKLTLSFDNLALTQLDFKRFMTQSVWDTFYMGDDGKFTMYIDFVEMKYAKSSTSKNRFDINQLTIEDMFAHVKTL